MQTRIPPRTFYAVLISLLAAFCSLSCASKLDKHDAYGQSVHQQSLTTPVYQINSGGGTVSPFAADQFATGGNAFDSGATVSTSGVANAAPAAVYRTERVGDHSYTFGSLTPGASYTVRLHFAEVWFTSPGNRTFNVSINGTQVLTRFDIFAAAGANKAVVRDFSATASGSGQITVQYVSVVNNAKSSGIEILANDGGGSPNQAPTVATPASGSPNPTTSSTSTLSVLGADDGGESNLTYTWATTGTPPGAVSFSANASNAAKNTVATFGSAGSYSLVVTIKDASGSSTTSNLTLVVNASPPPSTTNYQINCGGGAVSPFAADKYATGGSAFDSGATVSTSGVANAAPAAVYRTERVGDHSYTFGGLSAGASYTVRLHFAETWFTSPGNRTFNVLVNGSQVLTRFDIFAAAGANKAVVRDFAATASSSGQITTQYVSVVNNAKSSAIEILSGGGGSSNQGPTVATAASANPNPVTGSTSNLNVLGADDGGEANLTYTWATTGTPPGPVSFSANASNAAKNTVATFSQPGTYALAVTIKDQSGASVKSNLSLSVSSTPTGPSSGCGLSGKPTGDLHLTAKDGNGVTRDYEVLVPSSYTSSTPLAVTFVYHGAGGSSADAKSYSLQNAPGAAAASIFVFPQGIAFQSYGVGWNDTCAGYDMPFFDNMLAALQANYCVDPQRVYAAGFSWGCDHVTSLACCRGNKIRAIAAASCSDEFSDPANYRTYQAASTCPVTNNAAIRFTHATGGDGAYNSPLFDTTSALYRSFNGCGSSSTAVSPSPCRAYQGCRRPVVDCSYDNLGHALPASFGSDSWSFFTAQ